MTIRAVHARNLPNDPQVRLIWAAKIIASDIVQTGLERKNPSVFAGMVVALGRLYEAVTGNDMKNLGPTKILKWALDLEEEERIIVSPN